ncbi:LysR family transcriptional regulator [Oleispirillum naphthae]|uniref:LysR family transcriptional regulator n=1 Tax=Oleispirillum naphthae TaxID=2838853 RepID=UPI0030823529
MARTSAFRMGSVGDADLRLLRVFRTVVERGGFAQAEAELNVTRSAVSLAMTDLEKRLGLRLCRRGRAGFALTEEGRRVYDALVRLLTSVESFRAEVHAIHRRLTGELAIGLTDNLVTMPRMRVTNALKSLKEDGPDVVIRIRMAPPSDVEQGVLDGRLHVGVIPELRRLQGLDYQELYQEEAHLYCAAQHPLFSRPDAEIDIEALARCDAVMPAHAQAAEIAPLLQRMRSAATATDREGIAFLILTGLYVGFLPDHVAAKWVADGRMRPIRPDITGYRTRYAVIVRKGGRPNMVLDTFLQEVARNAES